MRPQTIDNVQRENLSSQKRKLLSQGHTMCLDSISPHANSTCLVLNTVPILPWQRAQAQRRLKEARKVTTDTATDFQTV